MKLKKVEIQGFKSFADKTEIEIKEGITAIVGPNGSGKSNISDAIRWVLGEQSVKNLRGSKMEDVIFAGTSKRRPLGFSEVTITFDNKSGIIPMDYSEVAITRRMFRSGESEYYINKNSCRLKDIRELFMDTGVGKDGYSIIGQGRIEEILSNRPEDRRSIFEEAAGIVKYKSKKEEAEKKLEKTQGNLIRIKDLIFELSNQSESLEIQANKANCFTNLYNKLKDLEINLFIKDIRKINQLIGEVDKEKTILEEMLSIKYEEQKNIGVKFNLLKSEIEGLEIDIENSRIKNIENNKDLEKNKNSLAILMEKEKYLNKDIERLKNEKNELICKLESIKSENNNLDNTIKGLEKDYSKLLDDYNEKSQDVEADISALQEKEKTIELEKDNLIKIYNTLSDKRSELNSISSFNENIYKRLDQLKKERQDLEEESSYNKNKLCELDNEEKELTKEVDNLKNQYEKIKKEHIDSIHKLKSIEGQVNQINLELQSKESSLKILSNMESDYEGYFKGVKSYLKASNKNPILKEGFLGVIADIIKVDEKFEKAIDISLGSNVQNIVIETEEVGKKIIEYLKKNNLGRITCLPLDVIKGIPLDINPLDREKFKILGLGYELVDYHIKYDNILKYLLGRTIIIENIDYGIKLANKYNHSYRIVTLDGDILNPGGSMTGGSHINNNISIIGRKNKIINLNKEINNLNLKKNQLVELGKNTQIIIENLDTQIKNIEEDLNDSNITLLKIRNLNEKHTNIIHRIEEDINRIIKEINSLDNELNNYELKKDNLAKIIYELELENEENKEKIKEMTISLNQAKSLREDKVKNTTEMKIQLNLFKSNINLNNEKLSSNLLEYNNTNDLILQKEEQISLNFIGLEEIKVEKDILDQKINETLLLEEKLKAELSGLLSKKENIMISFYKEQDRLNEINLEISNVEKNINSLEVKKARNSVQLENYHKKLKDDYELDFEEALKFEREIDNIQEAIIETRKLKIEIKELGTVNLSSIEEYKNLKERLDFILKQQEDLTNAKDNLKEVIREMENKMTKQFLENFKEINSNFKEIFKILFNGGQAELIIEDTEDVLNSGIDIQAQPPGKNLQSLSLLSGGEKSLTAVALLFSILRSKPSPFCILDEIDAALDEANISRYTNYLKTFCQDTQFVLITHRKTTMEIADILYGVAMEEEGVSKLISVKLKDYLDEIAS